MRLARLLRLAAALFGFLVLAVVYAPVVYMIVGR